MGNGSFQTQPHIYWYYFVLSIRPITFMIRQTPCSIELYAQFINRAHHDGQWHFLVIYTTDDGISHRLPHIYLYRNKVVSHFSDVWVEFLHQKCMLLVLSIILSLYVTSNIVLENFKRKISLLKLDELWIHVIRIRVAQAPCNCTSMQHGHWFKPLN